MPFPVHVQWTNSPSVIELLKSQEKNGLELLGTPGKGWAVWQGIGVATRKSEVVALFDADIRTFSSLYPSRMILPLLDESYGCLLYTSPSPRDGLLSRMPSSA